MIMFISGINGLLRFQRVTVSSAKVVKRTEVAFSALDKDHRTFLFSKSVVKFTSSYTKISRFNIEEVG